MRSIVAAAAACVLVATAARAECPADALGTARTMTLDAGRQPRIGTIQYAKTLPLNDREVVLTFDDGPVPPYSDRVLDILAAECVKATFFIVGHQAREFPEVVRRARDDGHTIATHSENHPRGFDRLSPGRMAEEIEGGLASTAAALGDEQAPAPFFRVPGLRTSRATEAYLKSRAMMVWSADLVADDWRHISAREVVRRALQRLAARRKGVLLLHDIQPATALALPELLRELKARGYRIVHVVPSEQTKDVPTVSVALAGAGHQGWPRLAAATPQLPAPSRESFGWPDVFSAREIVPTRPVRLKLTWHPGYQTVRVAHAHWPAVAAGETDAAERTTLPVPSPQSFGMPHPFGPSITLPSVNDAESSAVAPGASASAEE